MSSLSNCRERERTCPPGPAQPGKGGKKGEKEGFLRNKCNLQRLAEGNRRHDWRLALAQRGDRGSKGKEDQPGFNHFLMGGKRGEKKSPSFLPYRCWSDSNGREVFSQIRFHTRIHGPFGGGKIRPSSLSILREKKKGAQADRRGGVNTLLSLRNEDICRNP